MKLKGLVAGLAAAMLAGGAMAADVPTEYRAQLRGQLAAAEEIYRSEGYRQVMGPEMDGLGQGAEESYSLTLRSGWTYQILGVCDNDCSDLDLKIIDENGNTIAEDELADDAPIVEVTPKWTGKFTLEVNMYRCREAPCYYAVSVFGK
jgi:hypothetical protein